VAAAFAGEVLGTGVDEAECLSALAELFLGRCRRADRAPFHYLLARAAERFDNVADGERHLAAALAVDGHFAAALEEAAWYAEDRGDAQRALSLLHRAGVEEDDEDIGAPGALRPSREGAGRQERTLSLRFGAEVQAVLCRARWPCPG